MTLLAGASRAVVPVPFCESELSPAEAARAAVPLAGIGAAAFSDPEFADRPELTEVPELAELLELPAEHPARNMPPASMTPPMVKPAMAPRRVRPVRVPGRGRAKLRVFSMSL